MNEGMIPFPDESFDLVTSNQVLEHVEDLDVVVSEMKRVLKPGGQVLSLFPNSGIWREGHCGVPFLHWFPKRSRPRIYYAFFMRCIGFGQFTEGKTRLQWSKDFCEWLDNWTFYRSYEEIRESFESRLSRMQHMEQDWIGSRWRRLGKLPSPIQRFIAFRGGSMVFLCEKPFPAAADNRLSIDFAKAANATARPSALDTAA
jgi:SAM-dependent methyltransferase